MRRRRGGQHLRSDRRRPLAIRSPARRWRSNEIEGLLTIDGTTAIDITEPIDFGQFPGGDIENPSFGVVATEDNGLVEFVLVFERA